MQGFREKICLRKYWPIVTLDILGRSWESQFLYLEADEETDDINSLDFLLALRSYDLAS